jgi:hypothetical protein
MTQTLILYAVVAVVMVLAAIPLMKHKIPPNHWYGFRVPATLNDPGLWYKVNAYAASGLLWVGIMTLISAVALYVFPGLNTRTYRFACTAILVTGVCVNLVKTFRFLHKLSH